MSISADRFDEIDDGDAGPRPGTNAATILSFLNQHADKAFTQSEITEATGVTAGSVGPTLVRHRGRYWAIGEDDRLASYAAQTNASSASRRTTTTARSDRCPTTEALW